MKWILFFDLDGTLWNRMEQIPESAFDAVRQARRNGHEVWINTGRTRAFVYQPQLFDMGIDGIVSGAGTMIEGKRPGQESVSINWRDNQLYLYDEIPAKLAEETIKCLTHHRIYSILEGRDHLYCDVDAFGEDPFVQRVARKMGENLLPVTGNEGKWAFVKLSCDFKDVTGRTEALEWLGSRYEIFAHNENIMEFVPFGHTKGTGVLAACRATGIPVENTIAFGDGRNDIEMLDTVKVPVAMGNGTELARQHAVHVAKPYDQDGVAKMLTELGLIESACQ
ncbi:MAG: HAD-IIB family hydrolase [Clostridia bacterium]|nr:HAD-IIB family hydrolase [Clostridia bacterium]